ncbi:hypothetical protein P154DRAFT_345999 [Amniculicola lignicola CBS 123094]|uniref:Uncharacterized protein n=1 Tax=Amniculicola lignicola CBS 123094 TaxID=1392246 RepID=A0A6A5W153_9PLEO|nr:hypothetical protein P154DRAFT_345999 [Amniculicola lignicola CBS 123094]
MARTLPLRAAPETIGIRGECEGALRKCNCSQYRGEKESDPDGVSGGGGERQSASAERQATVSPGALALQVASLDCEIASPVFHLVMAFSDDCTIWGSSTPYSLQLGIRLLVFLSVPLTRRAEACYLKSGPRQSGCQHSSFSSQNNVQNEEEEW